MAKEIRIAIAGVGNCSSSLVQGLFYYKNVNSNDELIPGLMNNVLKPILLGRGVEAPMAVIFVGAIGGLIAHGIIGLFGGAVVFVLGYTLFRNWVYEAGEASRAERQEAG